MTHYRFRYLLLLLLISPRLRAQEILHVSSAVPAFIGYTEKAVDENGRSLSGIPTRINSLSDYRKYFGKADSPYFKKVFLDGQNNILRTESSPYVLYPSLRLYFDNGGYACYIISTGTYSSPVNKTDFLRGLDSLKRYDEPTLLVFPDAACLPGNDLYELQKAALRQAGTLGDRFCILDLKKADSKSTLASAILAFRENTGDEFLDFGAAYAPYIEPGPVSAIFYSEWKDVLYKNDTPVRLKDLATDPLARQKIDELETAMVNADPAAKNLEYDLNNLFPVMGKITRTLNEIKKFIPASGAVAGIICRNDYERGNWISPAGAGNKIHSVRQLAYLPTKDDERLMTGDIAGKYINPVKPIPGSGFMLWGARTLAAGNEWRYIAVRRFTSYVDDCIRNSLNRTALRENNATTWAGVRSGITNFLQLQWRSGSLKGNKPEQAYFVKAGLGETMTPQDVTDGKLIIEIGIAVQRPAEFIIRRYVLSIPNNQ